MDGFPSLSLDLAPVSDLAVALRYADEAEERLHDQARTFLRASKAPSTLRAYRSDWARGPSRAPFAEVALHVIDSGPKQALHRALRSGTASRTAANLRTDARHLGTKRKVPVEGGGGKLRVLFNPDGAAGLPHLAVGRINTKGICDLIGHAHYAPSSPGET